MILRREQQGIFVVLLISILVVSCNSDYTPRPKDYPLIEFPEKRYHLYAPDYCPFEMEISDFAVIERQQSFDETEPNPCWMNVSYEQYNAKVHFTYKPVGDKNTMEQLMTDAYKLTYKHTQKADFIEPVKIETSEAYGLIFDVGGDAASALQFFATDTTAHWLRGSLYFFEEPNPDSLSPVITFITEDIEYMLNTLKWKR